MNANQQVQQAMAEGKIKMGVCNLSKCVHKGAETMVYRVREGEYACGECLDKLDELIKALEAKGAKL